MAKNNLAACLVVTLAHEGGYSTVRSDPGNWTGGKVGAGVLKGTKYGVAASAFPNLDIQNLTLKDVKPIYEARYWLAVRGDDLPYGVDLATFDFGVNSGPSRAVRHLQSTLGVSADGDLGPATLRALGEADGKRVIQSFCARRLSFLRGLKIWTTFSRGWTRRVADVEARAVAMWLARGRPLSGQDRDALRDEAGRAEKTASGQRRAAGTAAGGGGVIGGGDAVANGAPNWLLIAGLAVIVAVIAAGLILKSRQNRERAAAYADAAG